MSNISANNVARVPKFRAWHKKEKRMFDIDSIVFSDMIVIAEGNQFKRGKNWVTGSPVIIDFIDMILMQSTGLKDKNGKEIFEGDIITYHLSSTRGHVIFHEGMFQILNKYDTTHLLEPDEHFILGNIHENLELLKEDK